MANPYVVNATRVIPGFQGKLFDLDGNLMAHVNRWQAQVNITNSNFQPAGHSQEIGIFQSYHVTLTFTETVVVDNLLLQLLKQLAQGVQPSFNFQGVLQRNDGSRSRCIFRSCAPQGNIDIANVQVGQLVERAWSFDVNEPPDLQEILS